MDPIVALITAFASIGAATLASVAVVFAAQTRSTAKETHDLVNSKMTELLAAVAGQAYGKGFTAGEQSQRDRQTPPEP